MVMQKMSCLFLCKSYHPTKWFCTSRCNLMFCHMFVCLVNGWCEHNVSLYLGCRSGHNVLHSGPTFAVNTWWIRTPFDSTKNLKHSWSKQKTSRSHDQQRYQHVTNLAIMCLVAYFWNCTPTGATVNVSMRVGWKDTEAHKCKLKYQNNKKSAPKQVAWHLDWAPGGKIGIKRFVQDAKENVKVVMNDNERWWMIMKGDEWWTRLWVQNNVHWAIMKLLHRMCRCIYESGR